MRYVWLCCLLLLATVHAAARPPRILPITKLPAEVRARLEPHRASLLERRRALKAQVRAFNEKCRDFVKGSPVAAQCAADGVELRSALGVGAPYARDVEKFNRLVERVKVLASRCAAFAKDPDGHRRAQERQVKAAALVAEGAASAGPEVAQRAAMIAARLAMVARHFTTVSKIVTMAAEVSRDALVIAAPVLVDGFKEELDQLPSWRGLSRVLNAMHCSAAVKTARRDRGDWSATGAVVKKCAKVLADVGDFVSKYGNALKAVAKHLGLAIDVAQLVKEVYDLAKELGTFDARVADAPARALEAAKHLDCDKELRDALAEGPK